MGSVSIREVDRAKHLALCAEIIRDSFATLAEDLGITRENCPSHPSFATVEDLERMRREGFAFFVLRVADRQVGAVAIEDRGSGLFYFAKLAVLPPFRHKGFGRTLVDFVFDYARARGGKTVRLATVDENAMLKNWYLDYGFAIVDVRQFDYLPFAVCFMEKAVCAAEEG